MRQMMERRLDRDAAPNGGPLPDYSNLYYWASSPYKQDPGDSIPAFLAGEIRETGADVFFIHPTTFIGEDGEEQDPAALAAHPGKSFSSMASASWNADLDDTALNRVTDLRPILYQATAFNGSCRVFAPRYRQANLKAFLTGDSPRAKAALDLAYSDVKAAFLYYLRHDNHGRPVIIASHSQGTVHAIRLLQEFFDGKPLQRQLVCAYLVGHQIEKQAFQKIPVCADASATGCFVGWRSFQDGAIPSNVREEQGNSVCVNPLNWQTLPGGVDARFNAGALMGDFNELRPQFAGARIEPSSRILWVTLPEDAPSRARKMKNLHVYDYGLFWMNIRQNVRTRVAAYLGH